MPLYRRVIEIHTGGEKNKFITVRGDFDHEPTREEAIEEWMSVLESMARKYETQVRFVPPSELDQVSRYMPALPGESGWSWAGEDEEEL